MARNRGRGEGLGVGEGDTVGSWGCGPVGLLAAHCVKVRGAKEVFVIDAVQYRLDHAKSKLPFVTPINFKEENVRDTIRKKVPFGVDVGIDAVGLHYAHSLLHKVEMAVGLEQETPEALNDIIYNVKKGGRSGLIGVYRGFANHFNLGGLMEKGLMIVGSGPTPVQSYWAKLLEMVENGELDPTIVITHETNLDEAPKMYEIFDKKEIAVSRCFCIPTHHYPTYLVLHEKSVVSVNLRRMPGACVQEKQWNRPDVAGNTCRIA